ncbi:small, acid-soluble spore protein, alpha/beta type [Bacillota bacterium LX-D]|nr:small, acid-soluble spore protein, alpha/beta type [Bacillota bacterium LX-D]
MRERDDLKDIKPSKKKGKKYDPLESLKLEIAEELGLLEKVKAEGWSGLSAKESGKIGGLMNKRIRLGN